MISPRESAENCHVPNAGFYENVVFEDPALLTAGQASDSCENDHMGDAADGALSILDTVREEENTVTNEVSEQITTSMADLQVVENASGSESQADDQHPLSVEDVDLLLDKCLLQALHTTVKDKDLPMPGSTLW